MNYLKVYCNLIRKAENRTPPESFIERHYVFPKGIFGDNNRIVLLTPREHYITHLLLEKIYIKRYGVSDKNTKKMTLACVMMKNRSEKYNSHLYEQVRVRYIKNMKEKHIDIETQKQEYLQNNTKNFYYWSTEEGRKERASLGGKQRASKEFNYWASNQGRKERASLGGKAHKGKKVMHLPGTKGWKRILPEDVDNKLNEGWKFGTGKPAPNSKVKK